MNFIVVGCGRVGAELAFRLFKNGHQVVVVDNNQNSFNRIHSDFRGRTVEGEALSADTFERAGMDKADGIAVVTNSDTMNAVIGHAVRAHYPQVKQVLVRNYDPAMRDMLESFGLQIVSSTAWGAERLQELLIDPSFRAVFSAGNGEVELYEMFIPAKWDGSAISDLMSGCNGIVVAALTRAGRAELPSPAAKLQSGDILTVSATLEGVTALRSHLHEGTEA
ncbi:MAG: TrkA family potassium uptake protein [Anaerolineales bacterium]|nr:TrkA family potassium uptake protein [Anaerolineales bacterium]